MGGSEVVAFCPHCSNTAPQRLVHVQRYRTHGYELDGRKTNFDIDCAYFVAECRTCSELLVYLAEGDVPAEESFVDAGLLWPDPGVLHDSVPAVVRKCYAEAASVKRRSPSSFAVQIRRSLEALCADREADGRTLQKQLQSLSKKGEIPAVLAEMTDILRLIGNRGAHASSRDVQPGHVDPIDEFFRAVIEYVYIAPHKISKLKQSMEDRGSIFGDE